MLDIIDFMSGNFWGFHWPNSLQILEICSLEMDISKDYLFLEEVNGEKDEIAQIMLGWIGINKITC